MTTTEAWKVSTVGKTLKIRYGKALDASLRDQEAEFPVVGSAGRMTATAVPLVEEPVVLIGRKGNVGAPQLELSGCWPIDTTYYASIPDGVDPRFLLYQLIALDMRRLDSSTTTPSLRRQNLEEQPLVIPPLNEQQRIVEILEDHLSRLDAATDSIRRSVRRLAALRDAALAEAVAVARKTPGVRVETVGSLAKVSSGLTPPKGNKAFYEGGTIPWITSGDLHQGLITEAKHFVTQAALDETTLKLVPAGAILIAMYGEGKTRGTAAELGLEATTNQACAAVVLHDSDLRPWVRLVLDANYTKLRRLAAGGVQPNLNQSMVKAIEIPIPIHDTRNTLLEQYRDLEDAHHRLEAELEATRARGNRLRHSLLAAAFSGRLTGEPAEALEMIPA